MSTEHNANWTRKVNWMAVGMLIGLLLGMALENYAVGFVLGISFGGALMKQYG